MYLISRFLITTAQRKHFPIMHVIISILLVSLWLVTISADIDIIKEGLVIFLLI